eukprot:4507040-Alexandrium_andersonii.AAC.1
MKQGTTSSSQPFRERETKGYRRISRGANGGAPGGLERAEDLKARPAGREVQPLRRRGSPELCLRCGRALP